MRSLVHIEKSGVWTDFSLSTGVESFISAIEQVFNKWMKSNEPDSVYITFANTKIKMTLYDPSIQPEYSLSQGADLELNEFLVKAFAIKDHFVIVSPVDDISNDQMTLIIFSLTAASTSKGFHKAVFCNGYWSRRYGCRGFKYGRKRRFSYICHSEFGLPIEFTSPKALLYSLQAAGIPKPRDFTASGRSVFMIPRNMFKNGTNYSRVLYFSNCKKDPIEEIHIELRWPASQGNLTFDNVRSESIVVEIVPQFMPSKETCLRFFIREVFDLGKDISWKELLENISFDHQEALKVIERAETLCSNEFSFPPLKSAPKGSILCTLAVEVAALMSLDFAAVVVHCFIRSLRGYFERRELIPGVLNQQPNYAYSMLYQKLQMINFCITLLNTPQDPEQLSNKLSDRLLLSGDPMFEPAECEVVAYTEDQAEQLEEIVRIQKENNEVELLGPSRTRLRYDIGTFKAANPTAVFADFVRWYSPTDYDETTKNLSTRMSVENGLWVSMWNKEPPRKQISQYGSFDPVAQAEVALDYIEGMTPQEVFSELIDSLLVAAFYHLETLSPESCEHIRELMRAYRYGTARLKELFKEIESAALKGEVRNSIQSKFHNAGLAEALFTNGIAATFTKEELESVEHFLDTIEMDREVTKTLHEYNVNARVGDANYQTFVSTQDNSCVYATSWSEQIV